MSSDVLEAIRVLLERHGVQRRELHHPPTHSSEESARARGEPLAIGGKALLMKAGERYRVFVISAARKLDSHALRRQLEVSRLRFASAEELSQLTGLVPGAVHVQVLPGLQRGQRRVGGERVVLDDGAQREPRRGLPAELPPQDVVVEGRA
jgi:hypothetical protein